MRKFLLVVAVCLASLTFSSCSSGGRELTADDVYEIDMYTDEILFLCSCIEDFPDYDDVLRYEEEIRFWTKEIRDVLRLDK